MGRQPCCDKVNLKRGPWTIEEDQKLMNFILNNGIQCWRLVPKLAGLLRCGKSCRMRWMNYLRPDLKRGAFSVEEEDQIIQLHSRLGNRWSKIASHFPGRTDNEIKNHWNTKIKKKLKLLGLDPQTHKPIQNSDTKENTLQPEPSKEAAGSDVELKPPDVPSFRNYQKENGLQAQHKAESGEKSEPISPGIDETVLQVDCSQQWINNVDSLLCWDGFSNLEDIFSI